ncbi:uncharacterized protein LOC131595156 isoform X2 [Vicia villosa]|uniref:uncharacterized protein LOC131595156 isoform X2 n=1 Tax=Vicia villosa TaxID=3911 RepID=UPI00273CBB8E|nr:uncharacterized protein LOC131595156 isoform X2 [Vicia villosa]
MGVGSSSTPTLLTELASPEAKVTGIFTYPIKSCRGISLPRAPLTPFGFPWDRQWVVVNSKGRARTQRVEPKLALVEVELPPEVFLEHWKPTTDSVMAGMEPGMVKAPGMEPLKVCLNKQQYEVVDDIGLWEWTGPAWDEGAEASKWFSDYLGSPCRLVRFNTASEVRNVDPPYVEGQQRIFFSDGYPFLLASQESLDALNKFLEEQIPMNRFRPNILVEGCEPYAEDLWRDIKISRFSYQCVKLCARCKIPQVNQETAIYGTEPTETLMKVRSGHVLRPNQNNKNKVYFGQKTVWNWKDSSAKGGGNMLKMGDSVYIIKKYPSLAEAAA